MKLISGGIVEGGFFHADRLLWMATGQTACYHLAVAACVIHIYFVLYFYCFLFVAVN